MHQPIINRQMLCNDILQGKIPFCDPAGAKPYLFLEDAPVKSSHNTPSRY